MEVITMLTELLKAVEVKKAFLEKELEKENAGKNREGDSGLNQGETERRLAAINDRSLKEYQALWLSFTPPGPFPCPLCYLFDRKVSPLKTLPRVEDVEPLICPECGKTFEIPVELLYA
jgi:hypothetical protein